MTKTIAFIQARMSSTRFPGKILADLCGVPMIEFMIERVKRAKRVDQVVLVTSTDASDDPVAALMERTGTDCFRGSLNDVLGRFYAASQVYPAKVYVRLTGDCPLIDPAVIDAVLACREEQGLDYASNTNPPTFPDGLDVEVLTREVLEIAAAKAKGSVEREHVTSWIYSPKNGRKIGNLASCVDASSLRVTVDYPDDLDAVRLILEKVANPARADYFDILRAIEHDKGVLFVNQHVRNEMLQESLDKLGACE